MPPQRRHPVTDTDTVTRTEPVVRTRVADAGEVTGRRPARRQARPTIGTLVLHDASDQGIAPYAEPFRAAYYASGRGQGVQNWRQLVAAIARYGEIERLVLLVHGVPGNLIVGGRSVPAADVRDLLGDTGTRVTRSLVFESCNVLGDPVGSAVMASRICASGALVGGFTYFSVFAPVTFDVPDPDPQDVGPIEEVLRGYRDYWLPGTPQNAREIASTAGEHTFYILWYRRTLDRGADGSPSPPPLREPGRPRARGYLPRDAMEPRRVTTREEAEELREEFGATHAGLRVTVRNVAAVARGGEHGQQPDSDGQP